MDRIEFIEAQVHDLDGQFKKCDVTKRGKRGSGARKICEENKVVTSLGFSKVGTITYVRLTQFPCPEKRIACRRKWMFEIRTRQACIFKIIVGLDLFLFETFFSQFYFKILFLL